MKLSRDETLLFFKLMLPLQFFVQEKLQILEKIESFQDYKNASFEQKFRVRNALLKNVHLIDDFIDENPQDIPLKELSIVSSWKKFLKGDFYVERHLKASTIFIGEDSRVYSVLGLTDSLDKLFPKYLIPQIVSAVLLPFQNQIVSDGFFSANQMYIGGNVRAELREIYSQAKKENKIIVDLLR